MNAPAKLWLKHLLDSLRKAKQQLTNACEGNMAEFGTLALEVDSNIDTAIRKAEQLAKE